MANIRDFEPLWGEWNAVKLLRKRAYGKVYLIEKAVMDIQYYATVMYIPLPVTSGKSMAINAEGLDSDDATLNDYYQQVLDSLLAEIEMNHRLKGNNIVYYEEYQVIPRKNELGYDIFIKMEPLIGLNEYIKHYGMTLLDVVKLGEDICSALTVLHEEKVRHQDINSGNIFVNDGGDYKLGGFNVTRIMERNVSSFQVKKPFSFMPPEVARGEEGDYRADLYSLGLILFRLLNNNRGPFLPPVPKRVKQKTNKLAQMRRMQGDELPLPALADRDLGSIILKACAYMPDDRWESADQMRGALADYRRSLSQEITGKVVLESIQVGGSDMTPTTLSVSTGPVSAIEEETEETEEPAFTQDGDETEALPQEEMRAFVSGEEITCLMPDEETTNFLSVEKTMDIQPEEEATYFILDEETTIFQTKEKVMDFQRDEERIAFLPRRKENAGEEAWEAEYLKMKKLIPVLAAVSTVVFTVILATVLISSRGGDLKTYLAANGSSTAAKSYEAFQLSDKESTWQDPVLEAGVRKTLGVEAGELDSNALAGVEELSLSGSVEPISTLADLVMLPGLKTLDLSGHPVEQFNFPDGMAELNDLNLTGCGCTDLDFMENTKLQGIINLEMGSNQVRNLEPLHGLKKLCYLDISDNPVQELTPLAGLPALKVLVAQNVAVVDWSPIDAVEQVDGLPKLIQVAAPTTAPASQTTASSSESSANSAVQVTTEPTPESTPESAPKPTYVQTAPKPSSSPAPSPTPTPDASKVKVKSISLSRSSILLEVGGIATLTAQVSPSNTTDQRVTWASSDPLVAKVDSNGNISAVGNGTAIITASCGGYTANCAVSIG